MSIKESITVQDACDLLNEYLSLDYPSCSRLITHRVNCNKAISDHPTIQTKDFPGRSKWRVGVLGLLNGMFGADDNSVGAISYELDPEGRIVHFLPTPERKCRVCGCTNSDCRQCIEKTGSPCSWVEWDLCSACAEVPDESS